MTNLREKLPYRPCVGIVVFNFRGEVFAGKRNGNGSDRNKFSWQLPQGGIDAGESPLDAARRELYEETGIRSISLLTQTDEPLYYDLPDDLIGVGLKGKYRGQRQDWFAFRFTGDETEINVTRPGNGNYPAEFSAWAWRDLAEMPGIVVPFKRDVYRQLVTAFARFGKI